MVGRSPAEQHERASPQAGVKLIESARRRLSGCIQHIEDIGAPTLAVQRHLKDIERDLFQGWRVTAKSIAQPLSGSLVFVL